MPFSDYHRFTRHPREVTTAYNTYLQVEELRERISVQQVKPDSLMPVADHVENGWAIRNYHTLAMGSHSTMILDTGLQFNIPAGIVGTISTHPYSHDQYHDQYPTVVTTRLYQHLPFGGVQVRLINHSASSLTVNEGSFVGLLTFHRCLRVELEELRPDQSLVGTTVYGLVRQPVANRPREAQRACVLDREAAAVANSRGLVTYASSDEEDGGAVVRNHYSSGEEEEPTELEGHLANALTAAAIRAARIVIVHNGNADDRPRGRETPPPVFR